MTLASRTATFAAALVLGLALTFGIASTSQAQPLPQDTVTHGYYGCCGGYGPYGGPYGPYGGPHR